MAERFDVGVIHKSEKTPEGFLRVFANVSKVGALQYLRADGSIETEYVTEPELFKDSSLETASMKPLTLRHPPREVGMVTPQNAMQYQRGFTGSQIIKNFPYATLVATITDAEAIRSVEDGSTTQISAGYRCKVRQREDGKLEQCDRTYNHFALVERGRAGADVCLHLDSADVDVAVFVCDEADPNQPEQGGGNTKGELTQDAPTSRQDAPRSKPMPRQFTINSEVFTTDNDNLADAVIALVDAQRKDSENTTLAKSLGYATPTEAMNGLKAKLDEAEGKLVGVQSKLDAAEAKVSDRMDDAAIAAEVSRRLDCWTAITPLFRGDANFKPDYTLTVPEIQKLAIAQKMPNLKLDGKSDEFIQGVWETLSFDTHVDSSDALHQDVLDLQRQDMGGTKKGMNPITAKRKERSKMIPGYTK